MRERKKVLIIEDNAALRNQLAGCLDTVFEVDVTESKSGAMSMLESNSYDTVLLDLKLSDTPNSVGMCVHIRRMSPKIPIIIISATGDTATIVKALNMGADDYLIKPFAFSELTARIRRALERVTPKVIRCGTCTIIPKSQKVLMEDEEIALSKTEYKILHLLVWNKGIVLSAQRVIDFIYGYYTDKTTNTVEAHICNIRKKLGHSQIIKTIYGVGYVADED